MCKCSSGIIVHLLHTILEGQEDIMTEFQNVQDQLAALDGKVTELQAAIDADQASDAQVVSDLNAQIDTLKAEIANLQAQGAVVSSEFQTAVDEIQAISDRVAAATADVSNAQVEGAEVPPDSEIPPPAA